MIRLIVTILLFLLSSHAIANSKIDCSYMYRVVESTDIRICSYRELSSQDISYISKTVSVVPRKYSAYIAKSPIRIKRIDVAVTTLETLNDGSLPGGLRKEMDVIGRYYPGDRRVYVAFDSIRRRDGVLAHEIVHMMNFHYGIFDRAQDERLAYDFESSLQLQ